MAITLPAPMLLSQRSLAPFGELGWIYELKFDGYRVMAGIQGGMVNLASKSGSDATKWFPELSQALSAVPGGPHILDGEVCVLDDLGRSDFNRLQNRARRRRWYPGCDPVVYCAFDLLTQDGRSLIGLPVQERKRRLQALLTPVPPSVLYVSHMDAADGKALFEGAVMLQLEGLVAKRLGSVYQPGVRSADWIKVKRKGAVPPSRFRR